MCSVTLIDILPSTWISTGPIPIDAAVPCIVIPATAPILADKEIPVTSTFIPIPTSSFPIAEVKDWPVSVTIVSATDVAVPIEEDKEIPVMIVE